MKTQLQKVDSARKEYESLVQLVELGNTLDVLKGKQLWNLKSNNLFKKAIGQGIDDWGTFLKLPEINFSTGEANRMMEMYSVFVLDYGFPVEVVAKAKTKSLHYLLPVVKGKKLSKSEVEDMLGDATHLTQAQFKESVYDMKTDNKGDRTYTYLIMKKCNETGNMQKVHDISSEKIVETFGLQDYRVIEML